MILQMKLCSLDLMSNDRNYKIYLIQRPKRKNIYGQKPERYAQTYYKRF